MQLTRAEMLKRAMARDRQYDGRFITGVLTTGIYCLPSCPARNPKAENIRFFATEQEARGAGLRPCKRCRPDLFYRNVDPDENLAADLAALLRHDPAAVSDVRHLAKISGVGITKLTALFRHHYHLTPAVYLQQLRADRAMLLLLEGKGVTEAALEAGYESLSAFHANMRKWAAMTPGDIRRIPEVHAFTLHLPADYRVDLLLRQHAWDGAGPDLLRKGNSFLRALETMEGTVTVSCEIKTRTVECRLITERSPAPETIRFVHHAILRLFGLPSDPRPFERHLVNMDHHSRLLGSRKGLRITQTATPFEGLVWVVFGQAVSLAVAHTLRTRLLEKTGRSAPEGLTAHPTAARVAEMEPAEVAALGTSRAKAETLVTLARMIVAGELPLDRLAEEPAGRIERLLGGIRGLGPWSINYLMMRSYGLMDCVPVGDSGLGSALQKYYSLAERPKAKQTLELMAPFAPHRSLATFHFWMSLGDEP